MKQQNHEINREKVKKIAVRRNLAVQIVGFVSLSSFIYTEFQRILQMTVIDMYYYFYLALMIIIVILIILWIWVTQKELDLLCDWMETKGYNPPNTRTEAFMIFGLCAVLLTLFFTSRDPLLFGVVFAIYAIINMLGVIYLNRQLRTVFSGAKKQYQLKYDQGVLPDAEAKIVLQIVSVLEEYFVLRPQTPRHIIILSISVIGLVLAICAQVFNLDYLKLLSYGIFTLLIIVSEIVIFYWRTVRDNKLRMLTDKLDEIEPSQEEEKSASSGE